MLRRIQFLLFPLVANVLRGDRHQRLMKMAFVGGASFMAGVISLWRDRLIAHTYGIGPVADTFYLGLCIPLYVMSILTALSQSGMMPTFVRLSQKGDRAACAELTGAVLIFNMLIGLFVAICILIWIMSGAPGLPIDPSLQGAVAGVGGGICLLAGAAGLFTSLLQSCNRQILVVGVNALPSIATAVALLAFSPPITVVLFAFLGGYALTALLGGILTLTREPISLPRFQGPGWEAFRNVARQYGILVLGIVFLSANNTIDQLMSAFYGPGQVTAYALGTRIPLFINSLITTATTGILLADYSRRIAMQDHQSLLDMARQYERIFLGVLGIGILPLILLGEPLLRLLFQTGAVQADRIAAAVPVFQITLLQLPFYSLILVYARAIEALNAARLVTTAAGVGCGLNILLNLLFGWFWGIAGIAVSTVLVHVFFWIFMRYHVHRLVKQAA